jgi:hypothetical protein
MRSWADSPKPVLPANPISKSKRFSYTIELPLFQAPSACIDQILLYSLPHFIENDCPRRIRRKGFRSFPIP